MNKKQLLENKLRKMIREEMMREYEEDLPLYNVMVSCDKKLSTRVHRILTKYIDDSFLESNAEPWGVEITASVELSGDAVDAMEDSLDKLGVEYSFSRD